MRDLSSRLGLRAIALLYLAVILVGPLAIVFWRTFEDGFAPAWDALSTPETLNAFKLTLIITAIAVPVNTVFGSCARSQALLGQGLLNAFIDLPSRLPVVVGLALFLLYGENGWFGGWLGEHGIRCSSPAGDGDRDDLRIAAVHRPRGRPDSARIGDDQSRPRGRSGRAAGRLSGASRSCRSAGR